MGTSDTNKFNQIAEIRNQFVEGSLFDNQSLSMHDRELIKCIITDFQNYLDIYGVELDYNNMMFLLMKLTTAQDDKITSTCAYNSEKNAILINPKMSYEASESQVEKDYIKAILSIASTLKQSETIDNAADMKPKQGLIFSIQGNERGNFLDEKLKDRIIERIYGNDGIYTLPSTSDEILGDIQKLVGIENLLTWFVNGRGDLLFDDISSKIGIEQARSLYVTMDTYQNTDINDVRELRMLESKYEKIRSELFVNVNEDALAM